MSIRAALGRFLVYVALITGASRGIGQGRDSALDGEQTAHVRRAFRIAA